MGWGTMRIISLIPSSWMWSFEEEVGEGMGGGPRVFRRWDFCMASFEEWIESGIIFQRP